MEGRLGWLCQPLLGVASWVFGASGRHSWKEYWGMAPSDMVLGPCTLLATNYCPHVLGDG